MFIENRRLADSRDAEAIARLVNQAYRPAPGEGGWTHESAMVAGPRTDAAQISTLIDRPESSVFLADSGDDIAACVHVERRGQDAYIGMLAVAPNRQGQGLGNDMLAYAEHYARKHFGAQRLVMVVVSARTELIDYYLRRGYVRTGETMDYPLSANVGIPTRPDMRIETLVKAASA